MKGEMPMVLCASVSQLTLTGTTVPSDGSNIKIQFCFSTLCVTFVSRGTAFHYCFCTNQEHLKCIFTIFLLYLKHYECLNVSDCLYIYMYISISLSLNYL